MRVVHCIYDDPRNPWVGGGGAVRLEEIYRRLASAVDVTLVTGRFPGARDEVRDGVRRRRLGASAPYAWSRLTFGAAATRYLAREPYDAAVFDFSAYSPVLLPAGRPVGVMLGQMAGPTARLRWGRAAGMLVGGWERRQLRRARHVAAVSPWLLDAARPLLRRDAETAVVGAGVADRFFEIERSEGRHLLFYGRFDVFQKGIDVLLETYALLPAEARPPLRIVGRGRDEGRIRAMVRERGLVGVEIVVDPPWPDLAGHLSGALALVMPSRFEGFGMVAAEAMAAGVPLVASRVDALPDVAGDAARRVPSGDAAATARAVEALLRDPAERSRLSEAARLRARRWSWETVARDHLAWLQRIAADAHRTTDARR
jgi:glycogen synthase